MTVHSAIAKLPFLMSSDLPQYIAPGRLAEEGVRLEGRVRLHDMTRLAQLLTDSRGAVELRLVFCRTENGLTRITGSYETALQLACQRCLEPVTVKLEETIDVGITFEGAAAELPASAEPLALAQDSLSLADFIEEEILLGLPISPMHALQECAAGERATPRESPASNPFHVLRQLKSG